MSEVDRYASELGTEALERQLAETENRFVCCGELRVRGHNRGCHHYDEPDTPEVIDGQESLI